MFNFEIAQKIQAMNNNTTYSTASIELYGNGKISFSLYLQPYHGDEPVVYLPYEVSASRLKDINPNLDFSCKKITFAGEKIYEITIIPNYSRHVEIIPLLIPTSDTTDSDNFRVTINLD